MMKDLLLLIMVLVTGAALAADRSLHGPTDTSLLTIEQYQCIKQDLQQAAASFHLDRDGRSFSVHSETQGYDLKVTGGRSHYHLTKPSHQISFEVQGACRGNTTAPLIQVGTGSHDKGALLIAFKGLDVQWMNSSSGVRQNFIVHQRPAGSGEAGIKIRLHSTITASLTDSGDLEFKDDQQEVILGYRDLKVWDASGRILPAQMHLVRHGAFDELTLAYEDTNANYPVTVDPISTTPSRLLIGTQGGAEFGFSVATAGDLNGDGFSDVAVGAWRASFGQTQEGAVYVYYGSNAGIPPGASVILQGDQTGALFGGSVSTAGDVNGDGYSDLIVGASAWESTVPAETTEGAAFVFHGSATGVNTVPDAILQVDQAGAQFGSSVATAGDVNGDGFSDVIVGAPLSDQPSTDEGAAFVYLGSATGVSPTFDHLLGANQPLSHFGRSVSSAGDINGDGYSDVVVGAPRYSQSGTRDGTFYIYYGSAGSLGGPTPTPDLTIGGSGQDFGQFGWSVTCAGDINGDGYSDVAVGAYQQTNGQAQEGQVYVYHGSAGGLVVAPAIILQSDQGGSWMGRSVSTAGDMNGDGYADLLVGISRYTNGQSQEGVGRAYLGSASGVSSTNFVQFELNDPGATMGETISVAGDVNGDGYSDVIIGARIYGSAGGASVHHGGPYDMQLFPTTTNAGAATSDQLGTSVASAGDVNGDGYSDVIVGAPFATNGQANEGIAYVYLGSANGITPIPHRILEVNISGQEFGYAVSTAGDVNGDGYGDVIVGAPGATAGSGRTYFYMGSAAGLSATPALSIVGTAAGGASGYSVSTAGDVNLDGYSDVVIGSGSGGRATVHLGSPTGIIAAPVVVLVGAGGFGNSVAYAGDVNGDGASDIIVGAPMVGAGGAVYIYHGDIMNGISVPANTQISSAVSGSLFGYAVGGAEDVNGDGYSDVIVGAPNWSNGQLEEGAALVYYGSVAGILPGPVTILERNGIGTHMGNSVSAAGDINGDGYADVCIGRPDATSGQANEGVVMVYRGTVSGIVPFPDQLQSDVAGQRLGASVAGAGDVDGDGYSDVIAGAPNFSQTNVDEGAFSIFHGNLDDNVVRRTRQYQANLVSPLAANSQDYANTAFFGIGQFARSHIHRSDARLQWEVVFEGQPFSGIPITTSVASIGQGATWTDLGVNGVELKQLLVKNTTNVRYKWRVRIEQRAVHMIDGQRLGRWFYGYASNRADIGVLPIELIHFAGQDVGSANRLDWTTVSEKNSSSFVVERSSDAADFYPIGELEAAGNNVGSLDYVFMDEQPLSSVSYYRLRMMDRDGSYEYSEVITIARADLSPTIYPVPATDHLNVVLPDIMAATAIQVYDATGRSVLTQPLIDTESRRHVISTQQLPSGLYTLVVEDASGAPLSRAPFVK